MDLNDASLLSRRRKRPNTLTISVPCTPTQNAIEFPDRECSAKRSQSFDQHFPIRRDQIDNIRYDRQVGPAEILPYLYLGSEFHATSNEWLSKHGIEAILNVSNRNPEIDETLYEYKHLAIRDSGDCDITAIFQESFAFIEYVRESGRKLMVHCQAGISRSATICIAYLMKTEGKSMQEGMDYVRNCRQCINPNFGFVAQLVSYETDLKAINTPAKPDELSLEMIDEDYPDSDSINSGSSNLSVWSHSDSGDISSEPSFLLSPTSVNQSFSFTVSSSVLSSPTSTIDSRDKQEKRTKRRLFHMHRPKWFKRASRTVISFLHDQLNF